MKLKIKILIAILFLSGNLLLHAQNPEIDFDEIKGNLSGADKFKNDFGRYKGFELPLNEGEMVNFAISSNGFSPKLILVDPLGNIFKQSASGNTNSASLIANIPKSGDWILYVVGGANDKGHFLLRYAFADASAVINIPENMDYCSTMNFMIIHAQAYFMMLRTSHQNNTVPKFPNSLEAFIDEESGSYVNIFLNSEDNYTAEKEFETALRNIYNCLPDWKSEETSWIKIDETVSQKSSISLEPDSKKPVRIILSLYHQKKENKSVYELTLEISKTP